MVFTSDFDSGNMGKVELTFSEENILEYTIDVAPDCCGSVHETGYKSWFFFGLSVAEPIELAEPEAEAGYPEVKPEVEPEVKPEVETEVKPEVEPEVKPEVKPEDGQDGEVTNCHLAENNEDQSDKQPSEPKAELEMAKPQSREVEPIQGEVSMFLSVRNMNNHTKLYGDPDLLNWVFCLFFLGICPFGECFFGVCFG